MNWLSKEHRLLYIVLLIGAFIFFKTVHLPRSGVIAVTIIEQKGALAQLDTPRVPGTTSTIEVDTIDFAQGSQLEHKSLGRLGFQNNFFMDALTLMQVEQAGEYLFFVTSDDGFRLKIDGKTVCEFPKDRAFLSTTCRSPITKGSHRLELSYFQGGGPMGLKAMYQYAKETKKHLIGDDSNNVTFEKVSK